MSAITTETWMPVSGTFKSYPLVVELHSWDGLVLSSKGHHDPLVFVQAALEEWREMEGWEELPIDAPENTPPWINVKNVQHLWWATRMNAWVQEDGYSYSIDQVAPHRPGAYPVTVIEH